MMKWLTTAAPLCILLVAVAGCRGVIEPGNTAGTLQPPEVTQLLGAVPPTAFIFRDINDQGYPEYIFEIDGSLMIGIPGDEEFEPFLVDKFEITNSQYKSFCTATARIMPKHPTNPAWRHYYFLPKPGHPIDHAAWFDAHDYARWAGKSLPTADEWTRVTLGAGQPPWVNGPQGLAVANIAEVGHRSPDACGSYPADVSGYGVYDLAGNIDEWVSDAGYGVNRRVMGGDWNSERDELMTLVTVGAADDAHEPRHGFRTVFRLKALDSTPR